MSDILDFFRKILPPENIFEIKTHNMEPRFEDLTKEQLIAELNVATEKNKYLRDRVDQFEQLEKKREFERRLAEATDFLKANGYEVVPATEIKRLHSKIKLDAETMRGAFMVTKGERIWLDKDMISFALFSSGVPYEKINDCLKIFIQRFKS